MKTKGDGAVPNEMNDETLVAYLDGELSPEETVTIDQQIEQDQALQKRLEDLRTSWDLLDELPAPEPTPDLAQTTIEMVALSMREQDRSWLGWLKGNVWLAVLAGALSTLALGTLVSAGVSHFRMNALMEDIPILLNFRELSGLDSAEWLERLTKIEPLQQVSEQDFATSNANQPGTFPGKLPTSNSERRNWLAALNPTQLAVVEANYRELQTVKPERLEFLRSLADQVYNADTKDAANYQKTLQAYTALLARAGTTERYKLFAIEDLDRRAEQLEKILRRELAILYPKRMTPGSEDYDAVRNWIYQLQDQEEVWDLLMRRGIDPDLQIMSELYRDQAESFISNRDIDDLLDVLSPRAQKLLFKMDNQQMRNIIGLWVGHVLDTTGGDIGQADLEELKARFESLSIDQQTELEFLPEAEARQRLLEQ